MIVLAAVALFASATTFAQSQQKPATNAAAAPVNKIAGDATVTRQSAPVQNQAASLQSTTQNRDAKKDMKAATDAKNIKAATPANRSATPSK